MNLAIVLLGALLAQAPTIGGRVLQVKTDEPIRKVSLELRALDTDSVQYLAVSRDDGRFTFPNVKPGKYRLRALHQGFVTIEHGQRKANGRGAAIEITADQPATNLQLVMTPTGAVQGRIYDANGQPVVKATVQALKVGYPEGKRALTVIQTALANDLGEYRLFWLPPGLYYLGAVIPNWNIAGDNITLNTGAPLSPIGGARFSAPIPDPASASTLPQNLTADTGRYLPVYFPNTTDQEAASVIEVSAGATLTGMDIQLTPVRTRWARGVAIDGDTGKPPSATPQAAQLIVSPNATGSALNSFLNPQTGAFEFPIMHAASMLTVIGGLKIGRVAIPYGESDVDGLQVVIRNGFPMQGNISVEGGATLPLSTLRVQLRGEYFNPSPSNGTPEASGAFTLQNTVPGDYKVLVTPLINAVNPGTAAPAIPEALKNVYVRSIGYGDVDVLNTSLQIRSGRPESALSIVLATNAATLSGTILDGREQPAPESMIVLVPANRTRFDLFRFATADAKGNFKVERIPPGDYKAFAWEDVDNGAWFDPQFLKTFEDRGTSIQITGDRADLRFALIN